jgi:hypothetical protein
MIKPPVDVTDFEEEFFEQVRKKSGRRLTGGVIDPVALSANKFPL